MDKLSYVCGKGYGEFRYNTLHSLLDKKANLSPNCLAHVFLNLDKDGHLQRKEVNFRQLSENSLQYAASLLQLGLKPKDRVAVLMANRPEYLYLEYACLRLGILMVRLSPAFLFKHVLVQLFNQHHVEVLITDGEMQKKTNQMFPLLDMQDFSACDLKHLKYCICLDDIIKNESHWISMPEINAESLALVKITQDTISPDDPALVYPTSGSTGLPKLTVHSHFKFINTTNYVADKSKVVFLNDRPFTWVGGDPFQSVISDFKMINVDPKLSVGRKTELLLRIMDEEKVTHAYFMGYAIFDIIQMAPKQLDVHIFTGGEILPSDMLRSARELFKTVTIIYSSTENRRPAMSFESAPDGTEWLCPPNQSEIKISNEDGNIVGRGVEGILQIRNLFMMQGYLDNPVATAQILDTNGWYKTGDIALMNENGQFKIMSRVSDKISRGGNKFYPVDFEKIIQEHPKVGSVAVVGVHDPRLFNEICACIIVREDQQLTQEELRAFYDQRVMDKNQTIGPEYYVFFKDFPKTVAGKIERKALKKQAEDFLGLQ